MILFDSVKKEFCTRDNKRVLALQNIHLCIPPGTVTGIIGASGSGKTTFLKLIGGLLQPESGRVRVYGKDPVRDRKKLRGQVNMLSAQFSNLDTEQSLEENLAIMRKTYLVGKKTFEKKEKELLQRFFLWERKGEKLKQLSLGFRRRAEVVTAFLTPGRIILFDEPCLGMDEQAKGVFSEVVREQKKEGRTILLSSHDMAELERISDQILLLDQGMILFYGSLQQLYRKLSPENQLLLTFEGNFPDMLDIPFIRYRREGQRMLLTYNRNHVTAAELVKGILETSKITEVSVIAPKLSDVIVQFSPENGGDTSELY